MSLMQSVRKNKICGVRENKITQSDKIAIVPAPEGRPSIAGVFSAGKAESKIQVPEDDPVAQLATSLCCRKCLPACTTLPRTYRAPPGIRCHFVMRE